MIDIIRPNWAAPSHIHALSTTRIGGYSQGLFESFNLAFDVGDDELDVRTNRELLRESLSLPGEPLWLKEVHGNRIVSADISQRSPEADGSFAKTANKICVITTADCLPVLLTNQDGSMVAALHCGWRGLAAGIIPEGLKLFSKNSSEILAWLGPAISHASYEISDEVREVFVTNLAENHAAFTPSRPGHWFMDLYEIARIQLRAGGVKYISGGEYCTYRSADLFYSFRRDGVTGRMASLIWMSPIE